MKKYSIIACLWIVLLSAMVYAQENSVSGAFSVDLMSSYVWRGIQCSNNDPAIQPDLNISYKGFTVDFWVDYNTDISDVDEVDIIFDYSPTFKIGPGEFTPSIGYIYYQLDGGDTQEVYFGGSYSMELTPDIGLNTALTVYRDVDTVHSTYLETSLGVDADFKKVTISPYFLASYYWYDHADDDWQNIELGIDVSFPIVGPLSGHAKFAYSFGLYDSGTEHLGDECYGGIGISFGF